MKKLLFVNNGLATGGIEMSLLNLINEIKDEYEIDLFLYNADGPLLNQLPDRVKIIKPCWALESFGMSFRNCLRKGSLKQKVFRIIANIWCKLLNNEMPTRYAISQQCNLGKYDVAIAYRQEGKKHTFNCGYTRLIDKCVNADMKIAWIHYDPLVLNLDEEYNEKYYARMDKIVCVSQSIKERFVQRHTSLENMVTYCYNTLNTEKIVELSNQKQEFEFDENSFVLFSATRLGSEKGITRALKALCPFFQDNNLSLKWYIAGDGPEKEMIEKTINGMGLSGQVILLGNQSNPYPYMKNANLYLSTSFHEAAPMVYLESFLLGTPIFTTETASSKELLQEYPYAYICENSESGIRTEFSKVIYGAYTELLELKNNKSINMQCVNKEHNFRNLIS